MIIVYLYCSCPAIGQFDPVHCRVLQTEEGVWLPTPQQPDHPFPPGRAFHGGGESEVVVIPSRR